MPSTKNSNAQKLILLVFTYGPNERRAEIELRPTIPESARGNSQKIQEWIRALAMSTMGPDLKFTNEWGCEICGKPSRETKYNMAFWTHLAEPRAVFYVHHLCATGNSPCHRVIKQQEDEMGAITGVPLSRGVTDMLSIIPDDPFPLASSCANCNDEKTASKEYKMSRCSACRLTRYCCPACQKADWPRHKKTCKTVESVKWENWPEMS